ncbi:MAG: hypothetical protein J6568_08520 [Snodgrassella sp.]|nr:hypothetical protein [Snodgrassella sp.]
MYHHCAANYEHIIEGNNEANELFGTAGKDLMYGYGGDDILHGNDGKDLFDGGDDNDILDGGAGDDQLFGGAGKDILEGGSGDDLLIGGSWQQDRYVFRAGHGSNALQGDILDFVHYRSHELWLSQSGYDLIISHSGSDDQVQLDNWFVDESFQQYQIYTADGMWFTARQIQLMVEAMSSFYTRSAEVQICAMSEEWPFVPQNNLAANYS